MHMCRQDISCTGALKSLESQVCVCLRDRKRERASERASERARERERERKTETERERERESKREIVISTHTSNAGLLNM